jgi:hypothetical protein
VEVQTKLRTQRATDNNSLAVANPNGLINNECAQFNAGSKGSSGEARAKGSNSRISYGSQYDQSGLTGSHKSAIQAPKRPDILKKFQVE